MKHITFYLDFISPYAWLAFERLPEALVDLSYSVEYRPVLLGAMPAGPGLACCCSNAPSSTGRYSTL